MSKGRRTLPNGRNSGLIRVGELNRSRPDVAGRGELRSLIRPRSDQSEDSAILTNPRPLFTCIFGISGRVEASDEALESRVAYRYAEVCDLVDEVIWFTRCMG